MNQDHTYRVTLREIREFGRGRSDRTGTGTVSLFGLQMRFDLSKSFPLLTSKRVPFKAVAHELFWFLKGETNIQYLLDNNVHIWDEWADEEGELGPVYGAQWRSWECPGVGVVVDQIADLMHNLKNDPFSRRHVVSAWNPAVLPDPDDSPKANASRGLQALPPCHTLFQFYVTELTFEERHSLLAKKGLIFTADCKTDEQWMEIMDAHDIPRLGLSCKLYQRSADMFLGVPFNIASYSLLTHLVAHACGMAPMEFIWSGGDCHIYSNHFDQVDELLRRVPPYSPQLRVTGEPKNVWDYTLDDIELVGYEPLPAIKAEVAV